MKAMTSSGDVVKVVDICGLYCERCYFLQKRLLHATDSLNKRSLPTFLGLGAQSETLMQAAFSESDKTTKLPIRRRNPE